jgi:hypothetical protein
MTQRATSPAAAIVWPCKSVHVLLAVGVSVGADARMTDDFAVRIDVVRFVATADALTLRAGAPCADTSMGIMNTMTMMMTPYRRRNSCDI